ncbi:MAG: YHYH domain-containing protein, partial [Armatimonadota bacterium]
MTCGIAPICGVLAAMLAHPGGLDVYGGHVDERTGTYHFHRTPLTVPGAQPLPVPRPRRVGVFLVSAKPHPARAAAPVIPVERTYPPLPSLDRVIEDLRATRGGNGLLAQALAMDAKLPSRDRPAGAYLRVTPAKPQAPHGALVAIRCLTGTVCPADAQRRADVVLLSASERLDDPVLRFMVRAESDGWYLLALHFACPSAGDRPTVRVRQGAQTLTAVVPPAQGAATVPALLQLFKGR